MEQENPQFLKPLKAKFETQSGQKIKAHFLKQKIYQKIEQSLHIRKCFFAITFEFFLLVTPEFRLKVGLSVLESVKLVLEFMTCRVIVSFIFQASSFTRKRIGNSI